MKSKNIFVSSVLSLSLASAFAAPPPGGSGRPDLSRLVVVGDSLSAGVENFSLLDSQQIHGYPSLIAQQAGVPLTLPLVPYPGAPNVLQLKSLTPTPDIEQAPGKLLFPRDNPLIQPFNIAVPGTTLGQALTMRPTLDPNAPAVQQWATIVLGFPGIFFGQTPTQIELAQELHPTTIIEALGNNDALVPALTGALNMLTPIDQFTANYQTVLDDLSATGATLIVANIPDVTEVPYLIPVQTIAAKAGMNVNTVASMLGTGTMDYVRLTAQTYVDQVLTGSLTALPQYCPSPLSALTTSPIPCVLTVSDAETIRNTVASYNKAIATLAASHNALLVDLHCLVDQMSANGYVANGQQLTTNFLGGLFSLDGIHPTNTGYGVIANLFIETINASFRTNIKDVNVNAIATADPLVFPGSAPQSSAGSQTSSCVVAQAVSVHKS